MADPEKNEKFYVRDNVAKIWAIDSNKGALIQFKNRREAKRFANKHYSRFTIISYNPMTQKFQWNGGEREYATK